jgi:hypothetical protein
MSLLSIALPAASSSTHQADDGPSLASASCAHAASWSGIDDEQDDIMLPRLSPAGPEEQAVPTAHRPYVPRMLRASQRDRNDRTYFRWAVRDSNSRLRL